MEYDVEMLFRDCEAMLVPSGESITLKAGQRVMITHRLGGNFTVSTPEGLARIEGKDADALGLEKPQADDKIAKEVKVDNESLWEVAKTVYDPEIPVNVVDLGLVYKMEIIAMEDDKVLVEVDMTLTAPGCAMGPMIANDLKIRLEALEGIDLANVNIVWDPPWNQDMMSEEARMILGLI